MMSIGLNLFCIVAAYVIGSIPSGYILAQWLGVSDIRNFGSGNIGASNVARLFGIKHFFSVLFLDAFKAYFFLTIGALFIPKFYLMLCAVALLVGNGYSLFLNFTGGKGVATTVGIFMALYPTLFFVMIFTWLGLMYWYRTPALASLGSCALLPFWALMCADQYGLILTLFASFWIFWRHQENMRVYYYQRR